MSPFRRSLSAAFGLALPLPFAASGAAWAASLPHRVIRRRVVHHPLVKKKG